jgi:Protein kinase domain
MGVVHLAQGPGGERVALKVLRPHVVGDDEARARLAREVASLRLVRSPRVAEVIDADPWGATPFVATRYVPGLSLHEHVRQSGPVTGGDLAYLAAGLAEAVDAVHRVGVLHRDIKPSNVLLEGRAPVLIDFGLARLAEDPRLTQTGWLLGTPGYLAPEILYGDDATTASDVHSWAATVVFAATGRPPFGRGPAMAIMDRVRRGEHDLSGVPASLLPLLRACLSPDSIDRPTTAAVLAHLRPERPSPVPAGFPSDARTVPVPQAPAPSAPPRTRHLTAATPTRAPYQLPPRPIHQPVHQPVPQPGRRPVRGTPRMQRVILLAGLFATVTVGFARAPYLSLAAIGVLALVVRTISWTSESARQRQLFRGRRRWFDAPLAVVSTPWYLVVATGGTVMLMLWSALLAFAVGFAYQLFRGPLVPCLLAMGAVLALALWWGPGGRRLRQPVRRLVAGATRNSWVGWVSIALVAGVAALLALGLLGDGVIWDPAAGSPWRAGTPLGTLLRWI